MPKPAFKPCIPTPATKVPASAEWIHEIKYDGYRLIVQREGKRVRLFTRNGHDWSDRYPLITEAALRNRISSFVIDGEAVLLTLTDGPISTACTAASTTTRCNSMPLTCLQCRVTTCGNSAASPQEQPRTAAHEAR